MGPIRPWVAQGTREHRGEVWRVCQQSASHTGPPCAPHYNTAPRPSLNMLTWSGLNHYRPRLIYTQEGAPGSDHYERRGWGGGNGGDGPSAQKLPSKVNFSPHLKSTPSSNSVSHASCCYYGDHDLESVGEGFQLPAVLCQCSCCCMLLTVPVLLELEHTLCISHRPFSMWLTCSRSDWTD